MFWCFSMKLYVLIQRASDVHMYLVLNYQTPPPGMIVRPFSHFVNFLLRKKLESDLIQNHDSRAAGGACNRGQRPPRRPIVSGCFVISVIWRMARGAAEGLWTQVRTHILTDWRLKVAVRPWRPWTLSWDVIQPRTPPTPGVWCALFILLLFCNNPASRRWTPSNGGNLDEPPKTPNPACRLFRHQGFKNLLREPGTWLMILK